MLIATDFPALKKCGGSGAVLALGTFDGLHRGHQQVIEAARQTAQDLNAPLGVVLFRRHPFSLIAPAKEPPALIALSERRAILAALGVDFLVELPVSPALLALSPDDFARSLAVAAPAALVAGENYTFGYQAAGNLDQLARCAARYGLGEVVATPLLNESGQPVSSSRIRAAVIGGEIRQAARLLGRDYALAGRVIHGEKLGRQIGFPTANLHLPPRFAVPPCGAYAAKVEIACSRYEKRMYPAIAAITEKPTAGSVARRLEIHLLDFSGSLYGENIRVRFVAKLRDEQKFSSINELTAQLARDKIAAQEILLAPN